MAARKITMKEMKQDRFRQAVFRGYDRLLDFTIRNWQGILAGLGVVLVAVLGLIWWQSHTEKTRMEASAALAEALETLPPELRMAAAAPTEDEAEGSGDLGASREALLEIQERYAGYEAGELALYYLAVVDLEAGETQDALERLETFVDRNAGHRLVPLALWMEARAHARLGEQEEVEGLYRRIIEMEAPLLPPDLARLYLAQHMESLDRTREALALYREIAETEEQTQLSGAAQRKVEELEALVGEDSGDEAEEEPA